MLNIENGNQHIYENDVILINEHNYNFIDKCLIYTFMLMLTIIFSSLLFIVLCMIYKYITIVFY